MADNKKERKASKATPSPTDRKKSTAASGQRITSSPDASLIDNNVLAKIAEETVEEGGKEIVITIESIANVKLQSPGNEIFIKASYAHIELEDSPRYQLQEESFSIDTDWKISIKCFPSHRKGRENCISNPIFLTVIEATIEKPTEGVDALVSDEHVKTAKGKSESTKGSSIKSQNTKPDPFITLGYCNLDLLPLLLGQTEIHEVLDVIADDISFPKVDVVPPKLKESSKKGKGKLKGKLSGKLSVKSGSSKKSKLSKQALSAAEAVGSTREGSDTTKNEVVELPGPLVLTVRASVEEALLSVEDLEDSNLLSITVESLHNLSPGARSESSRYQAGTVLQDEFNRGRDVLVNSGAWSSVARQEGFKRWNNLAHLLGSSSHMKHKLSEETISKVHDLEVDVAEEMSNVGPRVEWNVVQRCWLSSQGTRYLKDSISKYDMWPLEILITSISVKSSEDLSKKKKGKATRVGSNLQNEKRHHYVAFFDIKKLLYPGEQRTHVVGQVFTYCMGDMKTQCGVGSTVFALPQPPPEEANDGGSKTDKKQGKVTKDKSKASKKKTSKTKTSKTPDTSASDKSDATNRKSESKETAVEGGITESKDIEIGEPKCVAQPLYSESGKPVFVTLELEFWKPLIKKRTQEELLQELDKMVPKQLEESSGKKKEHADFVECIQSQAAILNSEYLAFLKEHHHISTPNNNRCNVSKDFFLYLCGKGIHQTLRNNLCEKVALLLADRPSFTKAHGDTADNCQNEKRNYVSHMYTLLIDEMHTAINNLYAGREQKRNYEPYQLSEKQLLLLAREEEEAANFEAADRYHVTRIERDKSNSKYLLDRAIFYANHEDFDIAERIMWQALSHNNRDKLSLLLYAMLLSVQADTRSTVTVFEALTALYPDFAFGGITFHLFYRHMRYFTGAEVVLEQAQKNSPSTPDPLANTDLETVPLCWKPDAYPADSIYLSAAVFLMRIGALSFAQMALAEQLRLYGPSIGYHYFLAVNHYLSGRFEEAAVILETLLTDYGRHCVLRALLGHCQYKMQSRDSAKDCYQHVAGSADRDDDIYLVDMRLGECYLKDGEYERAKDTYLDACRIYPTANSWLGVGKACYMLREFDESERALTEANVLNNGCAIIWGYLTLINLQTLRQAEYEQCYTRAIKCNLHDEYVLDQIEALRNKNHLRNPCVIHDKY